MNETPKILFVYTVDFPYGNVEPYLHNELPILCHFFQKVIIVSACKNLPNKALPPNVQVVFLEDMMVTTSKLNALLGHIFLISHLLLREFIGCRSKKFFLSRFRLTLSELLYGIILSKKIEKLFEKETLPAIHYSFWMNEDALALGILKYKKRIKNYVFRVHGYDLYEERRVGNYIPFREFCYRHSSGVYAVSKMGLNYIKQRYSFSEKARCSYLGTLDHGFNPGDTEHFTIVTCSGIIALKHLDLLAKALMTLDFSVTWYHFGQGKEEDTQKLTLITQQFPSNIRVVFKGQVSQHQLFDFYKTVPISLFLNVSVTEGLPVAIMEAISFGIPAMATDVGGTSEIVTEHTGVLIPKNITEQELADKIKMFKEGKLNTQPFRAGVKAFWQEHFSAERNYSVFCSQLLNLV